MKHAKDVHFLHVNGKKIFGSLETLEKLKDSIGGTISQNSSSPKIVKASSPKLRGCMSPESKPTDPKKKFCNSTTGNWVMKPQKDAYILHIDGKKIFGPQEVLNALNNNAFKGRGSITTTVASPKSRSPSPKRRTPSPKRRTPSPKRRTPSPKRRTPSPKRRTPSPKKGRKRSPSPKRANCWDKDAAECGSGMTCNTDGRCGPKDAAYVATLEVNGKLIHGSVNALESLADRLGIDHGFINYDTTEYIDSQKTIKMDTPPNFRIPSPSREDELDETMQIAAHPSTEKSVDSGRRSLATPTGRQLTSNDIFEEFQKCLAQKGYGK
jgi:hypothetical protein